MNILVALDGSDESYESIELIRKLPFDSSPNVSLLATYSDAGHHSLPADFRNALVKQLKDEAEAALKRAQAKFDGLGWNVSCKLDFGHPKTLILEHAAKLGADLIAVGAVGHSAVFRLLLGSTADYVANHAQCSVLVARPAIKKHDETKFLKIAFAYDGSDRANIAMSQVAQFRWDAANSSIHACRILERPELLPEEMSYDADMLVAAKDELQDMIDTYPSLSHVALTIRESSHVANAILHEVTEHSTDLLFVGDSGKSALGRFFLGSVSRYLLHHAPNSVWIARAKSWTS